MMMTKGNFKVQVIALIPILLLLVFFTACKNGSSTQKNIPAKIIEYGKQPLEENKHQVTDTIYFTPKDSTELSKEKIIYIIDGVTQPNDFDFSKLDSDTIESINIIKDPKIMGKYTANPKEYKGVVSVKTKKES